MSGNKEKKSKEDNALLAGETTVYKLLETIQNNSNNYSFDVYQRRALGKGKRSVVFLHSLFVITDKSTGVETTLSFNGTKLGIVSTGAWATNTKMDIDSYLKFKNGDNAYDMLHLIPNNMIDSRETAKNIINSIKSNTSYFAADHKINRVGAENCNTALFNTVSIKKSLPEIPISEATIKSLQVILKQGR